MTMEKKKKINWFKVVLCSLFIAYISIYTLHKTGYYDGNIRRKVEFTNEQIAKFESDVKNGEIVDLNDYLEGQKKNYTNKGAKLGFTISTNIEKFMNEGIKEISRVLNKFFT